MNNALSIYEGERFDLMQRTAQAMVKSGYFQDSRELAQAVVKVMAGAELGIAPFASMTGIHIVKGKPTLSSNLVATLVKNDPRYNYRVKVANSDECVLEWFENGELCGESSFTIQEAKKAGLISNSTWQNYPSDMLFARALTRGARRHAPGIFGGAPVYTPEELGADVDEDGYTVVEHNEPTVTVSTPEPPAPATNGKHADVVEGEVEDEPLFPDSKVADLRASIESVGEQVKVGFVCDRATQAGAYKNLNHAYNAAKKDGLIDDVPMSATVDVKAALRLFDSLMDRKAEAVS